MTEHEMDQIIADMVREQSELRRTIACLEQRLAKAKKSFRAAYEAAQSYDPSPERLHVPFADDVTFPGSSEFRMLLRDLKSARFKLQEVSSRLESI